MRAIDNDALICDFMQYYHIRDMMSEGIRRAAVLACGLPEESRIMRKLRGQKISAEFLYKAAILDTVRSIEHAYYQAHSRRRLTKPKSILGEILGSEKNTDVKAFSSKEEFEKARERFIKG